MATRAIKRILFTPYGDCTLIHSYLVDVGDIISNRPMGNHHGEQLKFYINIFVELKKKNPKCKLILDFSNTSIVGPTFLKYSLSNNDLKFTDLEIIVNNLKSKEYFIEKIKSILDKNNIVC